MSTRAPSLRKRAAVASPMPLAPPVTMTLWPSKRRMPVRRTSSTIAPSLVLATVREYWLLYVAAGHDRPDLLHVPAAHRNEPVVHVERATGMVGDHLPPLASSFDPTQGDALDEGLLGKEEEHQGRDGDQHGRCVEQLPL